MRARPRRCPAWSASAPQQPCAAGATTSQPSAASTRDGRLVDVAEEHALHAAGDEADAQPLVARGAACALGDLSASRRRRPARASAEFAEPRRQQRQQAWAAAEAAGRAASGKREQPQPRRDTAGRWNSSAPEQPIADGRVVMVLDGGARLLDERRVAHAGRAGRLARHAAEAGVEVLDERRRSCRRGPRRRRASGRCGRAANPFPARAAGSSDRSAGRSRSGRTCPSAARAARASANCRAHRPPGPPPGLRMPFGSNRALTARISERLPASSPQTSSDPRAQVRPSTHDGRAAAATASQRSQLVEPARGARGRRRRART